MTVSHDARDRRLREEKDLARQEAQLNFIVCKSAPFGETVADGSVEMPHHQRFAGSWCNCSGKPPSFAAVPHDFSQPVSALFSPIAARIVGHSGYCLQIRRRRSTTSAF
jgi:hypothetical protein